MKEQMTWRLLAHSLTNVRSWDCGGRCVSNQNWRLSTKTRITEWNRVHQPGKGAAPRAVFP